MKSFLEKVADMVVEQHVDRMSEICIVLTNRRASLFLKKYLSDLLGKTSWSPQIFSIEDFMDELSEYENISSLTALFELYEVHKSIEGKNSQAFDEFYKWGNILIQDFNEIDLHLVNAEQLFNYLSEFKSLADWKLEIENTSGIQSNYLKFFKSLKNYYRLLNIRLNDKKWAYNGKLFRSVAENIEIKAKRLKWHRIIFAGFNALSLAEEKTLFTLKEMGLADFLWDVDEYYLNHTNSGVKHEAGMFLRRYLKAQDKENILWIEDHLKNDNKNIQIYGVPKQVGQAKFCGQLLQNNSDIRTSNHKSAIILADENLLIPVLNSIPESYSELNVTMGLPLSNSPLFGFFNHLFKMQINLQNLKNTFHHKEARYRYADISKCLRHNLINNLSTQLFNSPHPFLYERLIKLKAGSQLDYTNDDISNSFKIDNNINCFIANLFTDWNDDPKFALVIIRKLIEQLRNATINRQISDEIELKIELELLYQFSILMNKIEWFITTYKSISNIKTLHSIFLQVCSTQKLPLYGEPLKGLQLMGMLESRNLDFDNLIILSVNENILPSSGKQVSFIPFELKHEFNIPTYREKNAIFAYHFFRLIQRSQNITLIYNSQPDQIAGGDKSRFIHQITDELAVYNPQIHITEQSISSMIRIKPDRNISILKNEDTIKRLNDRAEKGLSASSLNSFIRCSLQFYFKEIARLGEAETDNETIDFATLGTVVHEALKNLYEPLINKILTAEELKNRLKLSDQFVANAFHENYSEGNIQYGKNLLIVNVAQEFLKNFVQHEINELSKMDAKNNQKIIVSLESRYEAILSINSNGSVKNIKLKGFIDRIQTAGNDFEIIDYKTGTVGASDLNLNNWDLLITDKKYDKAFQLLMYAWLFSKNEPSNSNIVPGIYPLKQISNKLLKLKTPTGNKHTSITPDMVEFETQVRKLLGDIFNPDLKFEQTTDLTTCKYCDYRILCNK